MAAVRALVLALVAAHATGIVLEAKNATNATDATNADPSAEKPAEEQAAAEASQPPAKETAALPAYHVLLCNAFPASAAVMGRPGQGLESPLPYKKCRDSRVVLKSGDVLDFTAGEAKPFKFNVRALPAAPEDGQVLMLVVIPQASNASLATFMTHIYKKEAGPQLAVIDTFTAEKGSLHLAAGNSNSSEVLRFGTVVPVKAGSYTADYKRDTVQKTMHMDLSDNTLYVLMHVGDGSSEHPEKLMYFPNANPEEEEKDGSVHAAVSSLVLFLLAAVHWA